MMKMAMRPIPTQLPLGGITPHIEFDTNGSFNRTKYSMFGYTNYDILLVGAAGGRSGTADGRTVNNKTSRINGSGGGGGGFLRLRGQLASLNAVEAVGVGVAGGNGADSGNGVKASNGSNGGNTTFKGFSAFGGKGGVGGKYDITTGGVATCTPGRGGDGGGNSVGIGSPGDGGVTADANGTEGGSIIVSPPIAPTNGIASIDNGGTAVDGGGGGGGGQGRLRLFDSQISDSAGGSSGATGPGPYDAVGSPAESQLGGYGGGCEGVSFFGDFLTYGNAGVFRWSGGVAFIKLS